jgi:DNA repair protein RecO (recombination protein O)
VEAGRLATLARGARRPKSAFFGRIDLLVEADFTYTPSRRSDLHALGEVSVRSRFDGAMADIASLELAACAIAEIEMATESDTPLDGVFDLFAEFLGCLRTSGARPRTLLAWETRFLQLLGLDPEEESESLSASVRALLVELSETGWDELLSLKPENRAVREATRFLGGRFQHHFARVPKARAKIFSPASETGSKT